jgi:hypothetical protein
MVRAVLPGGQMRSTSAMADHGARRSTTVPPRWGLEMSWAAAYYKHAAPPALPSPCFAKVWRRARCFEEPCLSSAGPGSAKLRRSAMFIGAMFIGAMFIEIEARKTIRAPEERHGARGATGGGKCDRPARWGPRGAA